MSSTGNGQITGNGESTGIEYWRYLKYIITFNPNDYQNISINSIRFKIIENSYNGSTDKKEYLFNKVSTKNYESNNVYDYNSEAKGVDYDLGKTYNIEIDKIIVNDKYEISNFDVKHNIYIPPTPTIINGKLNSKIYTIFITIILNNNTIITILNNNNNKYTKLLKLLKKHLNSRNTNVKTLYYDLLNKIQQENTLIITTSSIININSLLKLLSEYLGINSKNPNILYRSLLTKK